MHMGRPIRALSISSAQQQELQSMLKKPQASQRDVKRAKIILARAEGRSQPAADRGSGWHQRPVVVKWEKRFMQHGIAGLAEANRSGRKPAISAETRAAIFTEATTPPPGRTQWSSRSMAKAKVVSAHTHKHPKLKSWIKWINPRHHEAHGVERIVMHFTPTSSSWLNLIERFFRDLTVDCIRDGSLASISDLVQSIEAYLAQRDLEPKRYVWKAEGEEILRKIQRAKEALATVSTPN